jgi:MFS family permease
VACVAAPGLALSVGLWFLSGMCAAYQIQAAATFVRAIPAGQRGQIMGFVGSGVVASQGVGIVVFGLVAEHVGGAKAVGFAGVCALLIAVLLALSGSRAGGVDDSRRRVEHVDVGSQEF